MSIIEQTINATGVVHNALFRYRAEISAAASDMAAARASEPVVPFEPPSLAQFTDVTDVAITQVDERLHLLDLMRNPGVRTAKTMASLLMVARAIGHIRRTGERVLLLTPTSGNKGTALRNAVARAHHLGLAGRDELRIVMVAPASSVSKLRDCPLTADPALRRHNPVALANVDRPADVKPLAGAIAERFADKIFDESGFRLWYTLDIDNYRLADAVRAFAEADLFPITDRSAPRVHAHAVSSAFGLLGYHLGHRLLAEGKAGRPAPARHPGFLLIQQLATPDMVTSLLGTEVPRYEHDPAANLWRQDGDPAFPQETGDPREEIDATFYTPKPNTCPQVNEIVARHGGGGVVVSRRECLERFDHVRSLAAAAGVAIGADPSQIREWSLVKALTGTLIARERGLIPAGTDVVVHASGHYDDDLLAPMRREHLAVVDGAADLEAVVFAAVHPG